MCGNMQTVHYMPLNTSFSRAMVKKVYCLHALSVGFSEPLWGRGAWKESRLSTQLVEFQRNINVVRRFLFYGLVEAQL